MSTPNTCELELVQKYGDEVVLDIISALAAASKSVEQERALFALAAVATAGGELVGVAA